MSTAEATGYYGTTIGLVYIFNLIIGTGALALPKAFQDAGTVLGTVILGVCCIISYMSATFVMESMSSANAVLLHQKSVRSNSKLLDGQVSGSSEDSPLLADVSSAGAGNFEIRERVELSEMAVIFLGKYGLVFFQLCLVIYLFGDLAIYSTVVPKSLMSLICTYAGPNNTCALNVTLELESPCLNSGPPFLTRYTMYRFMVLAFAIAVCPFVFAGVTKTKYLQLFTTLSRWVAFVLLIVLATRILVTGQGKGRPVVANFSGFGKLFGISVYSFMCHHSLPSLVTPMKQKAKIHVLFLFIFVLILGFYATLALTGAFAFHTLEDVYTLNFVPSSHGNLALTVADYFLSLFPVFTLSTNFPIVGITLRNNLRTLFNRLWPQGEQDSFTEETDGAASDTHPLTVSRGSEGLRSFAYVGIIPCLVVLPPIVIALGTDNVEILASVTGSYAGVGVQYVLPALLVLSSRNKVEYWLERSVPSPVASPFSGRVWPILLLTWAAVSVIIVSVNYAIVGVQKH